jgi:hypothetical protein
MRKYGVLLALLIAVVAPLGAQEFNFKVIVNVQKLTSADPGVFNNLKQSITEFFNSTKWTNDVFETDERIQGNILLTITGEAASKDGIIPNTYDAELAISVSRPVYGSSEYTPLINHYDKNIRFFYEQFQPVQFTRNTFNDNLSAVLGYYAFIILGMDYDSFSLNGGDPFFQSAQSVLNTVPSSWNGDGSGWDVNNSRRNRYWLAENMLSPRMRPLREVTYTYHRLGLDVMSSNVAKGRAVISKTLENLRKVSAAYPNSFGLQIFVNSKGREIKDIFKVATAEEKENVIDIMSTVDPANSGSYRSEIRQ